MTKRAIAALGAALIVAGCGFFSRPKNEFYSLQPIPPQAVVTGSSGTPIGIDGIELPPGLDRRGIVVRGADHRVEVRGTHQWTAPLEEMVIHTLAFDLASRLPEGAVILPGQAKPSSMRSLYVTFEDLAPGPDQIFVLDARWTLSGSDTAGHERITVPLQSPESASIAQAMSQALATLAERIVAGMERPLSS